MTITSLPLPTREAVGTVTTTALGPIPVDALAPTHRRAVDALQAAGLLAPDPCLELRRRTVSRAA